MNYNNLKTASTVVNLAVGLIILVETARNIWERYKSRKNNKAEAEDPIAAPATSPTSTPA